MMKTVFVFALFATLLGACSYRHTTVEQPAPATAAVVVPQPPPTTTVITTPGY